MKRSEVWNEISNIIHDTRRATMEYTSEDIADMILEYIENIGMQPPAWLKPIPFEDGKQYPLVPGDFKNEQGIWCTPGYHGWESEDGQS